MGDRRMPRIAATALTMIALAPLVACSAFGIDQRIADGQERIDAILVDAGIDGVTDAVLGCGQPFPGSFDCSVAAVMKTSDLADLDRFDAAHEAIAEIAARDVAQSDEDLDSVIRLDLSYGAVDALIVGRVQTRQIQAVLDAAPAAHPIESIDLRSNQVAVQMPESTPYPDLCATAENLATAGLDGRFVIVGAGVTEAHRVLLAANTTGTTDICARINDYLTTTGTGHTGDIDLTISDGSASLRIEFADDASHEAFAMVWGDDFPEVTLNASIP